METCLSEPVVNFGRLRKRAQGQTDFHLLFLVELQLRLPVEEEGFLLAILTATIKHALVEGNM